VSEIIRLLSGYVGFFFMIFHSFSWGVEPRFVGTDLFFAVCFVAYFIFMSLKAIFSTWYEEECNAGLLAIIIVTTIFILQLNLLGIMYPSFLFLLFIIILLMYLILFLIKDALVRESYAYLHVAPDMIELKDDIKDYIQNVTRQLRYFHRSVFCLYFIFITLLFSVIFEWSYARQFADILGIGYFFSHF